MILEEELKRLKSKIEIIEEAMKEIKIILGKEKETKIEQDPFE